MNRLESALRAVMLEMGLADLAAAAKRIGISQAQLSRILSGKIGLTPKTLRQIITGISLEPAHQFAILSAHLYDEAERSGFPLGLLSVTMPNGAPEVSFTDLPAALQKQLRLIGDEIKNGDDGLAGTVAWLAGMIAEHRLYPEKTDEMAQAAEGPDRATGPLTSPTDELIRAQDAKHKAAPAAGAPAAATLTRIDPTSPRRTGK